MQRFFMHTIKSDQIAQTVHAGFSLHWTHLSEGLFFHIAAR